MAAGKLLYTLEKSKYEQDTCQKHKIVLEYYCSYCHTAMCKDCEQVVHCFKNMHKVLAVKAAVHEFNQNATGIITKAQDIQSKLKRSIHYITNDKSDFEYNKRLCRAAIEFTENDLIMKVQEKSKQLLSELEKTYTENKEDKDSHLKDIDEMLTRVNNVMASINTIMNKPEETEILRMHNATINTVIDFHKSLYRRNIIPNFIPSTHLDKWMCTEGIGKITTVDCMYQVDKDDEVITVTSGQLIEVRVSSLAENFTCQLSATLSSQSGKESATKLESYGNGEYKITGRCNVECDWKMKITSGAVQIKGSPVNIKVEPVGLVCTIGNISDYKQHEKIHRVTHVVLDKDGYILVSSCSKDILKFNQSGSFVDRLQVPQDVMVFRMHQLGDGNMVYSDYLRKCVVICDDKYQEISSFGEGILKYPDGLTVNKQTGVLYVADREAHCVFKFSVSKGKLLGNIGSKGSQVGQMIKPHDVTLTKEGCVIVADVGNSRIQMFDGNDMLMKVLVGCSKEDGKVWCPCGVTMDIYDNIIVSSNHKLQLFDKNGVFIKRIDHDDGLDGPLGITVISNRPRRVAVANKKANNVKIFNY